jgi:hypothetical protein
MSEETSEIGQISLCLECEHFSGPPRYVAKTNKGIKAVSSKEHNWCKKHDADLPLMSVDGKPDLMPDISECESFKQK